MVSTAWIYEISLRQFLAFVTDPRYGWPPECRERFGVTPTQLLHESNSIVHVTEHEGNPRRRPLTYDEIHALFDAADARVEQIRAHHRKGATAAMRDAALLKTIYAFGIRRREAWGGLDLARMLLYPSSHAGGAGYAAVSVRNSCRGGIYLFRQRMISLVVRPSRRRRATYARVSGWVRIRTRTMVVSARFSRRSPPRLSL